MNIAQSAEGMLEFCNVQPSEIATMKIVIVTMINELNIFAIPSQFKIIHLKTFRLSFSSKTNYPSEFWQWYFKKKNISLGARGGHIVNDQ